MIVVLRKIHVRRSRINNSLTESAVRCISIKIYTALNSASVDSRCDSLELLLLSCLLLVLLLLLRLLLNILLSLLLFKLRLLCRTKIRCYTGRLLLRYGSCLGYGLGSRCALGLLLEIALSSLSVCITIHILASLCKGIIGGPCIILLSLRSVLHRSLASVLHRSLASVLHRSLTSVLRRSLTSVLHRSLNFGLCHRLLLCSRHRLCTIIFRFNLRSICLLRLCLGCFCLGCFCLLRLCLGCFCLFGLCLWRRHTLRLCLRSSLNLFFLLCRWLFPSFNSNLTGHVRL